MGSRYSTACVFLIMILGMLVFIFACSPLESTRTEVPPSEPTGAAFERQAIEKPNTNLSYLSSSNPAEVDNSTLPVTPTEEIHITGSTPTVDIAQYRLTIDGLVDREIALTYNQLLQYPTVTKVVLLICPGFFVDNAEWTGIPLTLLMDKAGIKPAATELFFHSVDGYQSSLSVEETKGDSVFLAHTVNGQVLPREHGYPLRLVLPGKYGSGWVKWVERIEVR